MPTDPYGFPESAPGTQTSGGAAVTSLWTGVGSLICGVLGPCMCYAPFLLALPLSAMAIWYGMQAKSGHADKGYDAAATAGIVSGGVSLFFSLLYLGFVVVYLAFIGLVAMGEF